MWLGGVAKNVVSDIISDRLVVSIFANVSPCLPPCTLCVSSFLKALLLAKLRHKDKTPRSSFTFQA